MKNRLISLLIFGVALLFLLQGCGSGVAVHSRPEPVVGEFNIWGATETVIPDGIYPMQDDDRVIVAEGQQDIIDWCSSDIDIIGDFLNPWKQNPEYTVKILKPDPKDEYYILKGKPDPEIDYKMLILPGEEEEKK